MLAQSAASPWLSLAAAFASLNDRRRNPFDWESWLEYDLLPRQVAKELMQLRTECFYRVSR